MENPAQDGWLWDIMVVLISAWGSLYKFIAKTEEILREWKKEVASDRCVNNSNLLRLFLLCFCMVCCVFNPKQLDTQLHTYKEDISARFIYHCRRRLECHGNSPFW
jgi:hypothetical protein